MKVKDWLVSAAKELENAGIGSARLDALILLEDHLDKDRAYILAHQDEKLDTKILNKLNKLLARRIKHEPMAYIRGFTEFYGRRFIVNKHVLEPRPESETMIDLFKQLSVKTVADIGTGSGAIAITAKLEDPDLEVLASDIDKKCLVVAKQNANQLNADIKIIEGDLFNAVKDYRPDILLCNLPYVPNSYKINEAAAMEPGIAIFGGQDGLELYRRLFTQIDASKSKPKYVLTESLPFQHKDLEDIAKEYGYNLEKSEDFIQLFSR